MNLFWLRYVSYLFLALAMFLYVAARLNRLGLSRRWKLLLFALCIAGACVTWRVREMNAEEHSPRQLVMGRVIQVDVNRNKSGSISDEFRLQLGGGALSPKFATGIVASSSARQPIRVGDTLGVLYRAWDDVPVTIDEIDGEYPGWHYRRNDNGAAFVFGVGFAGFAGLISLLFAMRNQAPAAAEPEFKGLDLDA